MWVTKKIKKDNLYAISFVILPSCIKLEKVNNITKIWLLYFITGYSDTVLLFTVDGIYGFI